MRNILRLCAGLILVFFLGFFLAGGRDVLRAETLNRVTGWATESVLPSAPREADASSKRANADGLARIKRLLFLREAIDERIAEKKIVPANELPEALRNAIVAVEDARFYSHPGFDIDGIARAALVNLQNGEIEEGASTITQQLAKNLFLSQEQSFARKAEELALAVTLELRYSKEDILALYLGSIYFGSGYYGICDASRGYFGKEPKDLTLPEAAMLAGLPNAPSVYSPYENFLLAKKRQFIVLDAMARNGMISEELAEDAKIAPIYLAH
ncbi:MAG: transglycosylase domain-containing protein [Schwartzia sp.]|nr:transglycosylase domain-containing protein [Schwartzia sp. (in: firmicutes)]